MDDEMELDGLELQALKDKMDLLCAKLYDSCAQERDFFTRWENQLYANRVREDAILTRLEEYISTISKSVETQAIVCNLDESQVAGHAHEVFDEIPKQAQERDIMDEKDLEYEDAPQMFDEMLEETVPPIGVVLGFDAWTNTLSNGVHSSPCHYPSAIDLRDSMGGRLSWYCELKSETVKPMHMGSDLKTEGATKDDCIGIGAVAEFASVRHQLKVLEDRLDEMVPLVAPGDETFVNKLSSTTDLEQLKKKCITSDTHKFPADEFSSFDSDSELSTGDGIFSDVDYGGCECKSDSSDKESMECKVTALDDVQISDGIEWSFDAAVIHVSGKYSCSPDKIPVNESRNSDEESCNRMLKLTSMTRVTGSSAIIESDETQLPSSIGMPLEFMDYSDDEALSCTNKMDTTVVIECEKENKADYWNMMFAGFDWHGPCEIAMQFFVGIRQSESKVDLFGVSSVISACSNLMFLTNGRDIHGISYKIGLASHVQVGSAMLRLYGKCQLIEDARSFFYAMGVREQSTWHSMLAGYVHCSNISEALHIFSEYPDKVVVSWTIIIFGGSHPHLNEEVIQLSHKIQEASLCLEQLCFVSALNACVPLVFFLLTDIFEVPKQHQERVVEFQPFHGLNLIREQVISTTLLHIQAENRNVHWFEYKGVALGVVLTSGEFKGDAFIHPDTARSLIFDNHQLVTILLSLPVMINGKGVLHNVVRDLILGVNFKALKVESPVVVTGDLIATIVAHLMQAEGEDTEELESRDACGAKSGCDNVEVFDSEVALIGFDELQPGLLVIGTFIPRFSAELSPKDLIKASATLSIASPDVWALLGPARPPPAPDEVQSYVLATCLLLHSVQPESLGVLVSAGYPWFVAWKPPHVARLQHQFTVQDLEDKVLIRGEGNVTYPDVADCLEIWTVKESRSQGREGIIKGNARCDQRASKIRNPRLDLRGGTEAPERARFPHCGGGIIS